MRRLMFMLFFLLAWLVAPSERLARCASESTAHPSGVEDAARRIDAMRREIARHDDLYFRQASPEISDAAYDALRRELTDLEEAYPELALAGRRDAGFDDRSADFSPAVHSVPMSSLAKVHDSQGLNGYLDGLSEDLGMKHPNCVVEPKIDGIAVSLVYEDGRLIRAVTRGDGQEGDDITDNVLMIEDLPRQLSLAPGEVAPGSIELRGEIYMSSMEFSRVNREREAAGEDLFAHPRNLAAGTIKSLDRSVLRERRLDVLLFAWGCWLPAHTAPATHQEFLEKLRSWNLPAVEPFGLIDDATELHLMVQEATKHRSGLAYPIDGVVIKLDDVRMRAALGDGAAGPRWAIAYKFPPDRASTRLRAITWQVGRSGRLTPVAELEPVDIAGATISRASLHNHRVIERLDLHLGDHVLLERAGEVIPHIVGYDPHQRLPHAKPFVPPVNCPACGAKLTRDSGEAVVFCANRACSAQVARRIEHFASVQCMDIRGLGPATIERLVAPGLVRSPVDLYRLSFGDLEKAGIGRRTAINLLASIEASRSAEVWRVIHGTGIPGVGPITAQRLANVFPDLTSFVQATEADMGKHGIDAGMASRVLDFVTDKETRQVIGDLIVAGIGMARSSNGGTASYLSGKTFVFTGKLGGFSRQAASARVRAAGGRVVSDVSRKTDFLVAGSDPGSKLTRAHTLGVRVISEAEFAELLLAKR